jgi:Transcriptional regulators
MARAKLEDVARLAGVHPATASRALNDTAGGRISAETAARVRDAAATLHYSPNQMARGLATSRSSTIGVIVGDLSVPLFPPILLGIDDVSSAAGYTALIVNTNNEMERETAHLTALRDRQVDGLIVATATSKEEDNERFAAIAPTVFVVRTPSDPLAPSVLSDDARGVHAAVEHLVSLGHRRIAHVGGPVGISTSTARLRAYREALFEAGLEVDPSLIVSVDHIDEAAGAAGFGKLIDSGADFTAVVAFNDLVALGGYRALRSRGLSCPDDISIVGYNDMVGSDLTAPPLTTVRIDYYAMGRAAGSMLLEIMQAPSDHRPHSVHIPTELVTRESTAAPRRDALGEMALLAQRTSARYEPQAGT